MDVTTPSPLTTTVRYALTIVGTIMATTGLIDAETWQMITGGIMAILPAAYGIWKQFQLRK